jgi:hypothetical protein
MGGCGLDLVDSGHGLMVGNCEYSMESEFSLNVGSFFFVLAYKITMAQVGQFYTEFFFSQLYRAS